MTLHDRVSAALADAGMKTASSLTDQLRRDAVAAGWDPRAAKSIQVHHHEGAFHSTFDEAGADYEYGDIDRAPLAVNRQWHNHLDDHAGPTLEQYLQNNLRGLL